MDLDLLFRELKLNLKDVVEWDVLGVYLGLEESEIDRIERDHQSTARRRIAMLGTWLKKEENPSWEKIIDALQNMSLRRLAIHLKEKYLDQQRPDSEPAHQPQITPVQSDQIIDINSNDPIAIEMSSLRESYDLLLVNVKLALEKNMPSLERMKRFFAYYKQKVVSTVDEFFDTLTSNTNFLNYFLVEKAIKFFLGPEHSVSFELSDYVKKLENFKHSKTLREFLKRMSTGESISIRLGFGVDRNDFTKLFHDLFRDNSSILTHLNIISGGYSIQGEMKLEYYCINVFL